MLDDVIRENLQVIIESIGLIQERFKKIHSADDFVSNQQVMDLKKKKCYKLNCRNLYRNKEGGKDDRNNIKDK